jgi:hypothetical protein
MSENLTEMWKRRDGDVAFVAAVVVLVAVVAWLLSPAVVGSTEKPAYGVGDSWEYSFTMHRMGLVFDGSLDQVVEAEGTLLVGSTTYAAFVTSLAGGGTFNGSLAALGLGNASGTFTLSGEEVYEEDGLKAVKTSTEIAASGTVDVMGSAAPFSLYVNNTTTNEIVSDSWHHPLDVGSTGSLVVDRECTESVVFVLLGDTQPMATSFSHRVTTAFEVTEETVITVPAGSLSVVSVAATSSDGFSMEDEFASEAGGTALRTVNDPMGQPFMQLELTGFSYSPPQGTDHPSGSPMESLMWIGALVALTVLVPLAAALVARRRHGR